MNHGLTSRLNKIFIVARKFKSNFFTMDIARKAYGEWIIIEPGDGQVAGLPENFSVKEFYEKPAVILILKK